MTRRLAASLLAASFLTMQCLAGPAVAENQMGYRLLTGQEASGLPRRGGALGVAVSAGQTITEGGMTFAVLRVTAVRRGSPGAQAGLATGDVIVAADGRVFPGVAAFSAYVGSTQPGGQVSVDYIPAGRGPKDAQRVAVTVGGVSRMTGAPSGGPAAPAGGLSTGAKVAIGVGAAALFGCYEMGCFSRSRSPSTVAPRP